MQRFAELLDGLILTPGATPSWTTLAHYFATTPDPDRGYALAAITGELSFTGAKPAALRALVAERVDEELFRLSYDYVGDLAKNQRCCDLNAELPLRIIAILNRFPQIAPVEIRILTRYLLRFIPEDRVQTEQRLPMELHETRLSLIVNEPESMNAETFHHSQAPGDRAI